MCICVYFFNYFFLFFTRIRYPLSASSMAPKKILKKSARPVELDELDDLAAVLPVEKEPKPAVDRHYYKIANAVMTTLAFATRFYYIWYPNEVVFDEVHFGKFSTYYLERTYYFDLHPPFAKMLIAFVGWLIGFNGKFKFENIGLNYNEYSVPYIPLRSLSAILGTVTVPLMFSTLEECNYSVFTCILGAAIVAFDNAHVAETRLILLDATLVASVAASIYCYVRFSKLRKSPFSLDWYKWLALTGVALSCVISTKYVGILTFFTVGFAVAIDLWNLLDYKTGLTLRQFSKHFMARFFLLIVVPFIIYLSWFWVHFAILTKSGPGDAFMSADFQETLEESILAKESKEVNYHDIITLKHQKTECYLHSHPYRYPMRYDDGRISSQGQQVTCVKDPEGLKDLNNQWEILPVVPFQGKRTGHSVLQGDQFRLRHIGTNGYLLTHDVASPFYPTNEEFTIVTLEEGDSTRFNDTLFKFDPVDRKLDQVLKTKASVVKVNHVPTVVSMWTHDDQLLPEWGFHQQEVNGNKNLQEPTNNWVIDAIIDLKGPRSIYIPKPVKKMSFFKKWWELQFLMFEHNNKLSSEHPYASQPDAWPICRSGVSFWTKADLKQQIFFIGNIPGWWFQCFMILAFLTTIIVDQLTRQRNVLVLTKESRNKLYNTCGFFFVGWCFHYLPFFLMSRQKFLHHYLPAHLIAALLAAAMFEFLFTNNRTEEFCKKDEKPNSINQMVYIGSVVLVLSILISSFIFFAPITYGNISLSVNEVLQREWMDIKLNYNK